MLEGDDRNPLDRQARERLAAILELMSSDRAGERDAAALAATRFVRGRDLRWIDVLAEPVPPDDPLEQFNDWRQAARFAAKHGDVLSSWERAFCVSISGFIRISEKQEAILRDCLAKMALAEEAAP